MPVCNHVERKFREIVGLLEKGEFQIPRFQRSFVWEKEQVARFIDSILRGFPTGVFVSWKTREKLQANREIGGFPLRVPKAGEYAHYILDGQQRLTALFLIHQGLQVKGPKLTDNYQDIFLRIRADENGEYCFVKNPKETDASQAVSVHDLISEKSIFRIKEKYNLDQESAEKFDEFKTNIENYQFPIIEITDTPLEEIVEIFSRINTGGTKLSNFEILCAKFYIPPKIDSSPTLITEKGFDLEEKFQSLVEDLERLDYGFDQPVIILQLISYLLRYDVPGNLTKKISIPTLLKLDPKAVQEEWEFVSPCFKHAAQLLKHDLKIPSFDFLPSVSLFMLMAYFYALNNHKSPQANQILNLRRLFFRSAFFGNLGGDSLLKQLGLVRRIYEEQPIDFKKELPFYTINKEFLTEEKLNIKSGLHRGILCVLATLEPKNFDNNSKVVLDNLFLQNSSKRNLHHFFPKNHLKHVSPRSNPDAIANMTFIDARLNRVIKDDPPQEYIQKYQQNNPELHQTLTTHLIDLNNPCVLEDYNAFLHMRAQKIISKIKEIT